MTGEDIDVAVADDEAASEVELEIDGGAGEHAGVGFAVGTHLAVLLDFSLGMAGAEIDAIEADTLGLERVDRGRC